ncbi:MAG: hypothetical protein AAFN78_10900 [Pseudomonadota bacterium]
MTTLKTRLIASALATGLAAAAFAGGASAQPVERPAARAVTMWWVVFNAPENCLGSPGADIQCNPADVFGTEFLKSVEAGSPNPLLIAPNMDAEPAVLFATGGITNRRGAIRLTGALFRNPAGEPLDLAPGVDPMGFGKGLENPDAEIHMVVRDHGAVNRDDYLPQITNFLDPYCSDPNLLYFSGDNLCSDVQFAVFGAGADGATAVFEFADPSSPLAGADAYLMRDGDGVRIVLETRIRNMQ